MPPRAVVLRVRGRITEQISLSKILDDALKLLAQLFGIRGEVRIATGHFRDGILLAPITARVLADVITGSTPAFDLTPFNPDRFAR